MLRMPVDIFPSIDIPVVAVVWSYGGLSPEEMERRVVGVSERTMSTTVNGIERIDSQSIQGVGILRVYFQAGTDIGAAIAQISSSCSTVLRVLPPGMTPPNIIQFNASNVPVVQLTAKSESLSEQQIYDHATNVIRLRLFTIPVSPRLPPSAAGAARFPWTWIPPSWRPGASVLRMCSRRSPPRTSSRRRGSPASGPRRCPSSRTPTPPRWRNCGASR